MTQAFEARGSPAVADARELETTDILPILSRGRLRT